MAKSVGSPREIWSVFETGGNSGLSIDVHVIVISSVCFVVVIEIPLRVSFHVTKLLGCILHVKLVCEVLLGTKFN